MASWPSATRSSPRTRRGSGRRTDCAPGTNPPSFDKQPLRDWLEAQPWDKQPPPPALPRRDRLGHLAPLHRRLRADQRAPLGRLVRCLTMGGREPIGELFRAGRGLVCVRESPTPKGPRSSVHSELWDSTVSPACGPGKAFRFDDRRGRRGRRREQARGGGRAVPGQPGHRGLDGDRHRRQPGDIGPHVPAVMSPGG